MFQLTMAGKLKLLVLFILSSLPGQIAYAQNTFSSQQADSATMLTLDEFYELILIAHPVVKQAELLSGIVRQEIRLARGNFDPKLNASFSQKEFTDKTYYSKLNSYLSVPTWIPVNPKLGYERNYGPFLNNENVITGNEQLYAGISVPIGRGLLTDERRTAVRQAALLTTLAEAEQVRIINKILLDAAKDYWQWYFAYEQYEISAQAVTIATDIFQRTMATFGQGELSAIDTVQAKITLQTRRVELQEALLELKNMRVIISNYLWDEQSNPLQLSPSVVPGLALQDNLLIDQKVIDSLVVVASENHPELTRIKLEITRAELDRTLARELLKPQLDLNYSMLSPPSERTLEPLNNYKLGVDFSFPLFLRKERSKVGLANYKITDLSYKLQQARREITNSILTTSNELNTLSVLLIQQREMVDLYLQLVRAEYLNLENGESDLFKINIQQEKLLQAQSKFIKLVSNYHKQRAQLNWAAGMRNLGKI